MAYERSPGDWVDCQDCGTYAEDWYDAEGCGGRYGEVFRDSFGGSYVNSFGENSGDNYDVVGCRSDGQEFDSSKDDRYRFPSSEDDSYRYDSPKNDSYSYISYSDEHYANGSDGYGHMTLSEIEIANWQRSLTYSKMRDRNTGSEACLVVFTYHCPEEAASMGATESEEGWAYPRLWLVVAERLD